MATEVYSDVAMRILDAAFRRLAAGGYSNLSTRDIASEAGVNHAAIHYYFGTKQRLVIAVLDEANRRLLERQKQLYDTAGDFAAKWARARRFYEDDLASGFVRVQMELWGASLSDPNLRKEFLPRVLEWRRIIEEAVRDALKLYELELPFSPQALACWISSFWFGMEFEMLLGAGEFETHHHEALDAMQRLLEHLDKQSGLRTAGAP